MVSVLGVAGAKARLQQLVAEAEKALAPFGNSGRDPDRRRAIRRRTERLSAFSRIRYDAAM